jgi:hypothetical protein
LAVSFKNRGFLAPERSAGGPVWLSGAPVSRFHGTSQAGRLEDVNLGGFGIKTLILLAFHQIGERQHEMLRLQPVVLKLLDDVQ